MYDEYIRFGNLIPSAELAQFNVQIQWYNVVVGSTERISYPELEFKREENCREKVVKVLKGKCHFYNLILKIKSGAASLYYRVLIFELTPDFGTSKLLYSNFVKCKYFIAKF